MSTNLQLIRNWIEQQKGKQALTIQTIDNLRSGLVQKKRTLRQHEQALVLIKEAGLKTQQQLQYHISDITSLALDAVFDEPYKLVAEFLERRNKTECDLFFVRENERIDPLSASGGGAVDVAAFALRIASWSMQKPKSRNVIILDEPLKYLSENYQEKGSAMIKEISQRLGIQFIIVTHEQTLASYADKVFEVSIKKGVSQVK
jgi:DNA repair exonuclease SbcCD ATPase subunit